MKEDLIFKRRKEKAIRFLKGKSSWVTYIILAFITFIAIRLRTRNLPGLRDITTGGWTLGPDLDPFFFLRLAEYIVQNGTLFAKDMMRYVPLGIDARRDLILHPHMIAWFHKIATIFGSESVANSAALYPVFMFALTGIAFFFLVRKVFTDSLGKRKANIVALISTFFLSVMPTMLSKTIAGIPEKESGAFLFLFLTFYFFLSAWKAKTNLLRHTFSILSGITTALMALIWGGYALIFLILSVAITIAFLLGKIDSKKLYIYLIWLVTATVIMTQFSTRYLLKILVTQTSTASAFMALSALIVHQLVFKTRIKKYFESERLRKFPKQIISLIIAFFLAILAAITLLGPSYLIAISKTYISDLTGIGSNRLFMTVVENVNPYFDSWVRNFGTTRGISLFFILFLIASIYLFYKTINIFKKKERLILTSAFIIFLGGVIFNRYSSTSIFNGTSFYSLILYIGGFGILVYALGFYYLRYIREGQEEKLSGIRFEFILLLSFFSIALLASRGLTRLFILTEVIFSIIVPYLAISFFSDARKINFKKKITTFVDVPIQSTQSQSLIANINISEGIPSSIKPTKKKVVTTDEAGFTKILVWGMVVMILLTTLLAANYYFWKSDGIANNMIPGAYDQQWQKAMSWVRDNTSQDAVFGHWWDYGYWVQSIGKRATVLDGGNAVSYWNHLMGRYALTGTSNHEAAEFLYSHNVTHFLIDSTDIGKYSSYSLVGSDENNDRHDQVIYFIRDNEQTIKGEDFEVYFYPQGYYLNKDIIYEQEGQKIFLPAGKAVMEGIVLKVDFEGDLIGNPETVLSYNSKVYKIPLRYGYDGEFKDFGLGLEAGVYLMHSMNDEDGTLILSKNSVILFLSESMVKSQVVRLYLYNEENPYFKLIHSEENALVSELKNAGLDNDEEVMIFNGEFYGPIKIWEMTYPNDITFNENFLKTSAP